MTEMCHGNNYHICANNTIILGESSSAKHTHDQISVADRQYTENNISIAASFKQIKGAHSSDKIPYHLLCPFHKSNWGAESLHRVIKQAHQNHVHVNSSSTTRDILDLRPWRLPSRWITVIQVEGRTFWNWNCSFSPDKNKETIPSVQSVRQNSIPKQTMLKSTEEGCLLTTSDRYIIRFFRVMSVCRQ